MRRFSQAAAPGARTRGMVQNNNAAVSRALGPGSGDQERVIGQQPGVARGAASAPPIPAPLGAPTPGMSPIISATGGRNRMMSGQPMAPQPMSALPPQPTNLQAQANFERISQRYQPNAGGLTSLMADPELQQLFPGATISKNDWIDLGPGVGKIDSINSYDGETGKNWQWLTEADAIADKQKQQAMARPAQMAGPSNTQRMLQMMQQQTAMRNALRG